MPKFDFDDLDKGGLGASVPLPPQRNTSFTDVNTATQSTTMSSPFSNPQPIRPPGAGANSYPLPIGTVPSLNGFGSSSLTANQSFTAMSSAATSPKHSILVRRLSLETTDAILRVLLSFSKEVTDIELLAPHTDDQGYRSALISFESPAGAIEAKSMLNGKMNFMEDAKMIVDVTTGGFRRPTVDMSSTATPASSVSSSKGSGLATMPFAPFDVSTTASTASFHSTSNGVGLSGASDLVNSEPVGPVNKYHMFSAQSPIGTSRARPSTKELLVDSDPQSDEQPTMAPMPFEGSIGLTGLAGPSQPSMPNVSQQPRLSLDQQFGGLSLNTAVGALNGSVNSPVSSHMGGPVNGHFGSTLNNSPMNAFNNHMTNPMATMGGHINGPAVNSLHNQMPQQPMGIPGPDLNGSMPHYQMPNNRGFKYPSVNLSDQNPPCNTLYVGNLPSGASEEELKAMFCKQRGYKRMCFRTKANGHMCFVEFDSITHATKALLDLYGRPLHNSIKGGIRLSFSKNPLGVRLIPDSRNSPAPHVSGGHMPRRQTVLPSPPGLPHPGFNNGNGHVMNGHAPVMSPGAQVQSPFVDHLGNNGGVWAHPSPMGYFPGNHAGTGSLAAASATGPSYTMGR